MIVFSFLHSLAFAQTADDIVTKVQHQQQWSQSRLEIELDIQRKGKKDKHYQLQTHLRKEDDTLYSHTEFLMPTEVAGTKVIAIDYPDKPDQLHLFMPALGRVNTLSSSAKKRAFMGSDLSFEDLDISNYEGSHSILSEDEHSWTIQTIGKDHPSYSRWIAIITKSNYQPTKIEFFDKKDALLKTMTIEGGSTLDHPFPTKVNVIDQQNKSQTIFQITDHSSKKEEIPLTLFQKEALLPIKEQK